MSDVVVFIVSNRTTYPYRRVLWRVSRSDAMKICSDPRTGGRHHMLCWTAHDIDDPVLNRFVPDNGSTAAVLAEHQVTILESLAVPRRAASAASAAETAGREPSAALTLF